MSNKRALAREWKHRRRQRRQMAIIGCVAAVILAVGAFGLYMLDLYRQGYVLTFEGNRISVSDFQFNLLSTMDAEAEDQKTAALDQLIETLVLESRGKAEGIVLTEEESAEMRSWAQEFKSMYANYGIDMSFITDERLTEIMSVEKYYEHLLDKYTADFTVDEPDYNRAFADYKANNKADYYNVQVKYAYSQSREDLEAARAAVVAGDMTFDELVAQHHVEYNAESGVIVAALRQLYLDAAENARIVEMDIDAITDIIVWEDYFLLVQVVDKIIPPDEELAATYREDYTLEKKREVFDAIVKGWKEEADYTVNQRGVDAA